MVLDLALAAIFIVTFVIGYYFQKSLWSPKNAHQSAVPLNAHVRSVMNIKNGFRIIYGTQTGNAKHLAESLGNKLQEMKNEVHINDMKDLDPEDLFGQVDTKNSICIFFISTFQDGLPPETAQWFCKWLEEASCDFRMSKSLLKGLKYAVFGLGNSLYQPKFNKVAIGLDSWLSMLQASSIIPVGLGDENAAESKYGGIEGDYNYWETKLLEALGVCMNGDLKRSEMKDSSVDIKKTELFEDDSSDEDESVVDVEDLGSMVNNMKKSKENAVNLKNKQEPKEMITPLLRKSLTKQGYKLLGTHSGVKMCRWTKSMLRGRGGCYKHTFYGIESHRCMETTPSLACANKCVFCWRHHSNPVGTEWKWKMDEPEIIVDLALKNHYNMIKEFKGVPGVKSDRLAEGLKVKHCALSLVGEPIMYPEINRLVELLHGKEISTFLVTNAQFPEAIQNLDPVTQLYVSVDASNEESLKKIDRPLFRDFWRRFTDSLLALSEKGQRTVYRLTLVKAWNTDEIKGYADLVHLGVPDFIEVKGVTYCGTSKASNLTMENVPWHEEVLSFVQQLSDMLPNYEIAAEHEHSNCVLLAHKKFLIDGQWHTWIDYDKFHELIKKYHASGRKSNFTSLDYMAYTPKWAVFGAEERGFDPVETRFFRKNRKDISGC